MKISWETSQKVKKPLFLMLNLKNVLLARFVIFNFYLFILRNSRRNDALNFALFCLFYFPPFSRNQTDGGCCFSVKMEP